MTFDGLEMGCFAAIQECLDDCDITCREFCHVKET